MIPLSKDQILSKLNPHYHDDFLKRTFPEIQKNEVIIWAGNYSYLFKSTISSFPFPPSISKQIGYLLITNFRIIDIRFDVVDNNRESIKINSEKGMILLPTFPLTKKEIERRYQLDHKLKGNIYLHKTIYEVNYKGNVTKIVGVIDSSTTELFFLEKEGEEFYRTGFEIEHNESFLNPVKSQENSIPPNFAEQIAKLKELYNYQILTKEEYKKAMGRLGLDIDE